MQRIGFIGIGLMGQHMARNIMAAGYPLTVWNRTAERAKPLLDDGAEWADSVFELAEVVDVVITMVTDSQASKQVICGKEGVLLGSRDGLIVIDMSSIHPDATRDIAERCDKSGVRMLDAPVTGAPHVAEKGKLGIMVGGDSDVFEQCRPILESMGEVIVYAGDNGQGSTLKLINNLILGVTVEVVGEALTLARKCHIEPEKVVEITSVGGAKTSAMEVRGPRMIERNFQAGFTVNNMHKDMNNVMQLASSVGAPVPTAAAALEVLRAARTNDLGGDDSASVVRILERLASIEIDESD